ncbi:MAG: oligosaccharide flippase family protein [Candidatus Symbiothrix sp.]|jgi:O-antigen/teichoic acid export membrane protein|nr:oligosaccharide flippase family protein [Candidatus Symbiothrix sp.]
MSIKKNIVYNVALNVVNMLFPIVTAPYISRVLGVENVGLVNFVIAYVSYFVLFAALGVSFYGVREIAKYKGNPGKTSQIFSEIFRINLITTLIVSVCYFASIFYISDLRQDWLIFVLAGISLYLAPISIDWYFQGLEDFKIITYRSFVVKCCAFCGLFIFVRQRDDIIPYLLLSVFSIVGTSVWNVLYAKKRGLKLKWRHLNVKTHVKPMVVFFASNVAISIFTVLDILMLGFLSSYEQVGFFASPNKILILIMVAFGSINTVILPRISSNQQQNDAIANKNLLQKVFDIHALLIIPASVGLCLISARFVPLFFGQEFAGSIVPMQILSFKVIVVMLNVFFASNVLVALGHENKFLIVLIVTAVLSVILNWFLIPCYGATGAAVTTVVVESFELLLSLLFTYKLTTIRMNWKLMGVALLFVLPFFALYVLFNELIENDILFLSVFIGVSALLYLVLQLFVAKNYLLDEIKNLLKNKTNACFK